MEQKIIEISSKFTILQKDVDELKNKYIKMEKMFLSMQFQTWLMHLKKL